MLVREEDKAMENPIQLPESKYTTAAQYLCGPGKPCRDFLLEQWRVHIKTGSRSVSPHAGAPLCSFRELSENLGILNLADLQWESSLWTPDIQVTWVLFMF